MKKHRCFLSFLRSASGSVIVEAAFTIPLLIFLILGMIELCRYEQFQQKLTDSAQKMVNILNQQPYLLASEVNSMPSIAANIMAPFATTGSANALYIYVTAIQQNAPTSGAKQCNAQPYGTGGLSCPADVMWQVAPTGQSAGPASQVAPAGGCTGTKAPPNCPTVTKNPNGQTWASILQQYDQVIAVEVFLKYTPLLNVAGISAVENTGYHYQLAFATPRLGQFQSIPAGSTPMR